MSKLWTLIKIQLQGAYLQKSKKKSSIAIMILFVALIAFMGTVYGFMVYDTMQSLGLATSSVFIMSSISLIVSIFVSTANVRSLLFDNQKQELLMKLPIKNGTIVLSKMATLLLENLIFIFLLSLPVSVMSLVGGHLSPGGFTLVVLLLFILAIFASSIASILGFVISYFTSRYKWARVLVTALSLILSLVGAFLYFFFVSEGINYFMQSGGNLVDTLQGLPFFSLIAQVTTQQHLVALLILAVIATLLMSLIVFFYHRSYKNMYSLFQNREKRAVSTYDSQSSKPEVALVKKDLTKLIKTPFLLMNSSIFPLIFLGYMGYLVFRRDLFEALLGQVQGFNLSLVFLAVSLAVSVSSQLSGISISIEMDKFWILKTLPMKPSSILFAKAIPQFLIVSVVLLFYAVFGILVIKILPVYHWLMIFLISVFFSFAHSLMGVVINLYFPKIDADSEQDVIKRSTSIFICFIYAVLFFLLLIPLLPLSFRVPMDLLLVALLVIALLYVALAYFIVTRKGVKLFKALS